MTERAVQCPAYRSGDMVYCSRCRKSWNVDDPEPPPCDVGDNRKKFVEEVLKDRGLLHGEGTKR